MVGDFNERISVLAVLTDPGDRDSLSRTISHSNWMVNFATTYEQARLGLEDVAPAAIERLPSPRRIWLVGRASSCGSDGECASSDCGRPPSRRAALSGGPQRARLRRGGAKGSNATKCCASSATFGGHGEPSCARRAPIRWNLRSLLTVRISTQRLWRSCDRP
jgi:hypothetical protein